MNVNNYRVNPIDRTSRLENDIRQRLKEQAKKNKKDKKDKNDNKDNGKTFSEILKEKQDGAR